MVKKDKIPMDWLKSVYICIGDRLRRDQEALRERPSDTVVVEGRKERE